LVAANTPRRLPWCSAGVSVCVPTRLPGSPVHIVPAARKVRKGLTAGGSGPSLAWAPKTQEAVGHHGPVFGAGDPAGHQRRRCGTPHEACGDPRITVGGSLTPRSRSATVTSCPGRPSRRATVVRAVPAPDTTTRSDRSRMSHSSVPAHRLWMISGLPRCNARGGQEQERASLPLGTVLTRSGQVLSERGFPAPWAALDE
jgi:hypothetical protein